MDWRKALAPEAAQAERASSLRRIYELLKRVDRSMADKDQRDLCQQTEMSLWLKAKSLDDYRRKIQLKCSKLEAAAQAAAAAAGSLQQQLPQPAALPVAAQVAYAAFPPVQQQPAFVAPTGVYYAPPPPQPPHVPSVAAPPPRGVGVNGHGHHHIQYQHPAAASAHHPPPQCMVQHPYAVAPVTVAAPAQPPPQRPMQQQPYAVAVPPQGMPAKRKLEQTAMAAVGVAPVAAAAAPVVGVVPLSAAAAAASQPPEAKRARVDAAPSVPGAAAVAQQQERAVAVAVAVAPAPEQRMPTRAEAVAPYLEDYRYFLQHVDGYQPGSHSATQVTGWRAFIQNLVEKACAPEATSMPVNAKVQAGVQQAGTFARVYRKSHAEFLKRKQLQQQLQQQQLAMPITVKKEEKEGDDVLAAALAAELEEGPIGQAGEQFQPSLNWAGLRQLVLETARAAGDAGGGGGKRTQALQNAPALVTAALAARGLLSLEGDGGGQGAVQRLRATVNAAMARLASEGGRLGQGMVDGLGLLARADVLLQEIRGAYGGGKGGKRGEQEEEERLGAADPLALARFWVGVEGTPTEQPTVVVSGLAAWIAGLDAAAVDEEGGVGSAEALAAALTRVDARFEEGKGPYRLEARGRTVLRVTHTAAAVEESSRLGRQQQEGQWSGTEWAADVVLGKEKHGPSTTPAAAAMVPVLVRVVVEGNAGSAWSRRAEAAAAGALLRWGFQKGGSSSRGTVRTVAAVLEELRATLRPGVCGLTGRALAMDAGGGGAVELVAPYCTVSGGGRLAYSYCHY